MAMINSALAPRTVVLSANVLVDDAAADLRDTNENTGTPASAIGYTRQHPEDEFSNVPRDIATNAFSVHNRSNTSRPPENPNSDLQSLESSYYTALLSVSGVEARDTDVGTECTAITSDPERLSPPIGCSLVRKNIPPNIVLPQSVFKEFTNTEELMSSFLSLDVSPEVHSSVRLPAFSATINKLGGGPSGYFTESWQRSLRSPNRHHRRVKSGYRDIKETLDAQYRQEGDTQVLNQYIIKEEIGRGSYGAVSKAIDSQTNEIYAIKEFSKSRLRRQIRSNFLRQRSARSPGGSKLPLSGFHSPGPQVTANEFQKNTEDGNSLNLIRREIAILKKLDHVNVANLIEVLDNPTGDSLYMVLEWCGKGEIMKVGVDSPATPYDEEQCRLYFRDLILGIEYLHSQGTVHRDIKPDNLLLNDENVLKIVDFGVSEIFEKDNDAMTTAAGTPAFQAPELCAVPRVDYSGRAADIWAMGVTLYYLAFGRLPFEKQNIIELYSSIQYDEIEIPETASPELRDLLQLLLIKDFKSRITMPKLRVHPWVTLGGLDELLSEEENTGGVASAAANAVTQQDIDRAISGIRGVFNIVRAVNNVQKKARARAPSPGETLRANSDGVSPMENDMTEPFTPRGMPIVNSSSDASSCSSVSSSISILPSLPENAIDSSLSSKDEIIRSLRMFHEGLKLRLELEENGKGELDANLVEDILDARLRECEEQYSKTNGNRLDGQLSTPDLALLTTGAMNGSSARSKSLDTYDRKPFAEDAEIRVGSFIRAMGLSPE
ncbi:kinase-like domain-containing protein [Dipodascopsis uninucleata]